MVLPLAYSHIYSLKLCPNFMIEVIMSLWISDKPVPYMKGSQCCFIPNTKHKYHLTRFWQDGRYSVTIFLWGNICRNYSHKNNTRRIHRSLPWPLRSRNRQPLLQPFIVHHVGRDTLPSAKLNPENHQGWRSLEVLYELVYMQGYSAYQVTEAMRKLMLYCSRLHTVGCFINRVTMACRPSNATLKDLTGHLLISGSELPDLQNLTSTLQLQPIELIYLSY